MKADMYSGVYREMARLIGEKNVEKLWDRYKGMHIDFPQKLYSQDYVRNYIREHMETDKPADIARNIGLTERRVRQIQKEIREDLR